MIYQCSIMISFCCTMISAGNVETIIDTTLAKYEDMESLYAEFEQVYCDEVSGTCMRYEGILHFLQPSFFKMEIIDPRRVYVSDCESLWIYIPEENRAIRQSMEQVPFHINPEVFLKDYKERFAAELSAESESSYEITLTPQDEADFYDKIVVVITKNRFEIAALSIHDKAGSENKYTFNKIELNRKIKKSFFEFKPPKGTQIDEY
jgi:chaperone LolA